MAANGNARSKRSLKSKSGGKQSAKSMKKRDPVARALRNGAPPDEPERAASVVGLRYVSDERPGCTRRRRGKGWSYHRPDGSLIRDEKTRERIAALAIPPAWTDVWICPDPRGHIQATGRDDRGRKQYRYHERWSEMRDATKFHRMVRFGEALPGIRASVQKALRERNLSREKVLATVIRLLETTCIRIGNDEYARENDTYGLTTIRKRHVDARGSKIRFEFEGKGGQIEEVSLSDARIASVVRECQDLPGYELLKYIDEDGERRDVKSEDVNEFIREISGEDFTAKDFRTWMATVHAFSRLSALEPAADEKEADRNCIAAIDHVAELLRNTRDVCRSSYIHPRVLESYREGDITAGSVPDESREHMDPEEVALLRLLEGIEKDDA